VVLDEFEFDRAGLRSKHVLQLQQLAARIAQSHQQGNQPIIQIVVVGHTDKQGSDAYNWGLGFRRAITAADYLRRILEQRYNRQLKAPLSMRAETEGEFAPVSRDNAKNRRVEIHLLTQRIRRSAPPLVGPPPYGGGARPPPPPAQGRYEFENEPEAEAGYETSDREYGDSEWEDRELELSLGGDEREMTWEGEVGGGPSYIRNFSGPNAECTAALARAGKTQAQALAIINAQIGSAIRMLRVAANKLKRGSRSSQTKAIFQRIFRVPPGFVPTWLKQTATIRDRGDVVAVRCRRVADLLASGRIRYFCSITSTNCPDCGNDNSPFACSSWGSESTAPRNSNVICFGSAFWDAMKNGATADILSTVMHEPFHIYFGKYVTEHAHPSGRSVGKFGGIDCIVRFVFEINGRTATPLDVSACNSYVVRSAATGY
jgi:hypothetical protein